MDKLEKLSSLNDSQFRHQELNCKVPHLVTEMHKGRTTETYIKADKSKET